MEPKRGRAGRGPGEKRGKRGDAEGGKGVEIGKDLDLKG